MYKKKADQVYKAPNFDEYRKKMENDRVEKLAYESRMPVVEIQGAP